MKYAILIAAFVVGAAIVFRDGIYRIDVLSSDPPVFLRTQVLTGGAEVCVTRTAIRLLDLRENRKPGPAFIAHLHEKSDDKDTVEAFDKAFGEGAAELYLQGLETPPSAYVEQLGLSRQRASALEEFDGLYGAGAAERHLTRAGLVLDCVGARESEQGQASNALKQQP